MINNKKYINRECFSYKKFVCSQVFLDILKLILVN